MILPAQTIRALAPVYPLVERTVAHGMTFEGQYDEEN